MGYEETGDVISVFIKRFSPEAFSDMYQKLPKKEKIHGFVGEENIGKELFIGGLIPIRFTRKERDKPEEVSPCDVRIIDICGNRLIGKVVASDEESLIPEQSQLGLVPTEGGYLVDEFIPPLGALKLDITQDSAQLVN